ncbi:MAG TPA: DUF169 domain-containing protein [Chloroflexota bacterium]|nr:DUF169 domain-containing protein [Chloroflexota bacterium]
MTLQSLRDAAAAIESILRLKSFPLAVKMLRSEDEIPEGAKRPVRDLGRHLSTCQGFALSRRDGLTVAQTKEDMWCFEPVLGYGLAKPPKLFLEGQNQIPKAARTLEVGRTWVESLPRLALGEYIGVVSAPAKEATFEPDLVIVYCDPSQLTQLLMVKDWMDGVDVASKLSGHAACIYAVVPTLQTGEWSVASPCRGDRARALASDDEIAVSIPAAQLPETRDGLIHFGEYESGLPLALSMLHEYPLAPGYVKIGRMIGMDWLE